MSVPILEVFPEQRLAFVIYPFINTTKIQHEVKYIIARDYPAVLRDGRNRLIITVLQIIFKEIGSVKNYPPLKPQLLGNDIKRGSLTSPVSSVQDGHRFKIQPPKPVLC